MIKGKMMEVLNAEIEDFEDMQGSCYQEVRKLYSEVLQTAPPNGISIQDMVKTVKRVLALHGYDMVDKKYDIEYAAEYFYKYAHSALVLCKTFVTLFDKSINEFRNELEREGIKSNQQEEEGK